MKREIKFRGLRADGKGWVYGSFLKELYNSYIVECVDQTRYAFTNISVTPETVGQFTELKDRNGKEIYEGDVLYSSIFHKTWIVDFTPCDGLKLAIKYEDDFKFDGIFQTHEDWSYNKVSSCLIIGNIHEKQGGSD